MFEFGSSPEETKGPGNILSKTTRQSSSNTNGVNATSKEREPEINSEDYEKIRIMLGAGQYDNQLCLSGIFLEQEPVTTT